MSVTYLPIRQDAQRFAMMRIAPLAEHVATLFNTRVAELAPLLKALFPESAAGIAAGAVPVQEGDKAAMSGAVEQLRQTLKSLPDNRKAIQDIIAAGEAGEAIGADADAGPETLRAVLKDMLKVVVHLLGAEKSVWEKGEYFQLFSRVVSGQSRLNACVLGALREFSAIRGCGAAPARVMELEWRARWSLLALWCATLVTHALALPLGRAMEGMQGTPLESGARGGQAGG